jgi:DNA polymerase elongation subunit (family B)
VTPRFLLPSGKFYVKELEGPRTLKEGESFAGAVVVEPDIGLKGPTSTYDFASLYPSESCSKNLCFTTMIPHRNKEEVLDKMRGFCRVARLNAENMTWERTENWFVTGERPCALTDLREAISILRAEDCPYDAETRAALQKDVDILEDPVNAEMARKWTPLAEGRPANLADGDAPPSDDELVDIYLRIVEPACRILGRTKTNVRRPDMPAFVQEEMREGVFPHIQKNLKQMRNAVKREMGDYCNQLEGLSREGVRDSDGSVVRLKQSVKKMDTVQQAIKCVMNSIYGVYAIFSKMLAETVTDLGRSDLETSLCIVDTMIGRQTGFISRSIGVYGDTDSVFGEWVDLPLYAEEEMLLKKIRIQKRDTGGQEEGWEACMTRAREVGVAVRERLGLEESSSTKIAMYVCWYLAMKDVLDGNCMNLAALPRTQRFTPSDLRVFQNKMDWLANLMISSLGVDVSSVQSMISNSEWKGIGRAANPPSLPPSGRPFEPIMLHDFVCWISIQIVNGQSKKVEGLMNGVFKRKHPTGYIVQEHEKTYRRLLLCRKKKYGGSKYLPGGSTYKVDLAGVTAVRGDTYPFKALACKKVMEALADYGDVDLATALAEDIIRRVVQRKISPHQLIQSKKVKKDVTEYGAAQPHGLEQIVPTKGMPLHIVGAIERHLDTGEPLPLVDSRYAFLVRDVPGKKKIKIGKRIMSPVDVLRAGGSLLYDTEYYAEGIANLVSNILAPVIDPSTGEQRLKIAEGFRRIRDKSVRSKAVNKHFETLRRHTKKIMMTFAQQGAKHQKDSPHGRASSSSSSRRDSLQQRSIKSMFQATAAPCRAVQSSDAKDSDQDDDNAGESSTGVTDSRAILTATLTRESEARLWKKISSLSKISVGEGVKSTAYNPSGSAGVLSSTLAEKESTTQASMLTFAVAVSIECGCCGRPGNKGHFCRRCVRSGRVAETVALVEKKIVDAMVDQAHVCADCYGVARPDVGGEERRKRTRGEDPTDSRGRSILDIEDCVGEFYERNQTVKACMRIVCQTRWERAELENQLKMVKLLRTQYVLFSNKRVKK